MTNVASPTTRRWRAQPPWFRRSPCPSGPDSWLAWIRADTGVMPEAQGPARTDLRSCWCPAPRMIYGQGVCSTNAERCAFVDQRHSAAPLGMRARQVAGRCRAEASTTHDRDATRRHPRTYIPMARTVSRPLDRVAERRRAAALARHYRDSEELSIGDIARRLGRAPATVKAYLYDPTGDKARAVKARYRGTCRSCGAATSPRNGKGDAHAYCHRCRPAPPGRSGLASACATPCADGPSATGTRRRHTTGHAPTPAAAATSRCDVSRPPTGPRPPR